MATNETVTLTAELKDELSAPLDAAAKKVDDFTDRVVKGSKKQQDANKRFSKSTAQITGAIDRQKKQYGGLLGVFQKVGMGGQKLFGGLSSSVSKSWQRIAGEATKSGKDAGDAFGRGLKTTLRYAITAAAAYGGAQLFSSFVADAANASDATDKFRSTMSFAGLNTTAIDMAAKAAKAYADQTVYDLPTIQNMIAQLASNGIKDYTGLAKAAGNLNAVAGGSAETFKSVAMTMTQTAGAGKLTTENWNQLTDAIPGAAGPLMKAMLSAGAYTGNFREEMEKGEITADEFNAAIMKLGNMPVAVEAAKSTKTFEGALGNLKATINSGLMVVLDALKPKITSTITLLANGLGGAVEKLTTAISVLKGGGTTVNIGTALGLSGNSLNVFVTAIAWIERAHAAFDRFKTMIAGFGVGQWSGIIGGALLLVAAFGKISFVFGPIMTLFSSLGPLIGQLGGALRFLLGPIGIIAGLFIYAYSTSEQFRSTVNGLLTTVLGLVTGLASSLMPVFQQLVTAVMPILTGLMQQLVPVFTMVLSAVAPLAVMLISQLAPVFLQLIGAVLPPLMGLLGVLVPIFGQLIAAVAPIIPPIAEIVGLLLNLAVQIITPLIPLISSIASILATVLGGAIQYVLMPVIKFLIDALVNLVTFLKGPLGEAINWIAGLFEGLGGMIKDTQKNIGDFVSNPLGGVQDMLGIPKNAGGGVYAGGGVVGKFAGGGVLGGYAPGHDSILARLSPGESVLVPELTREIGPQNIMAANAAASGGRPAGSGPALTSGYSGRGGGSSTSLSIGQVNFNVPVSAAGTVDLDALHSVAVGAMQDALDEHNRRSY